MLRNIDVRKHAVAHYLANSVDWRTDELVEEKESPPKVEFDFLQWRDWLAQDCGSHRDTLVTNVYSFLRWLLTQNQDCLFWELLNHRWCDRQSKWRGFIMDNGTSGFLGQIEPTWTRKYADYVPIIHGAMMKPKIAQCEFSKVASGNQKYYYMSGESLSLSAMAKSMCQMTE